MSKPKRLAKRKAIVKRGSTSSNKTAKIILLVLSFLILASACAYHAYKRFGVVVPVYPQQATVKEQPSQVRPAKREAPPLADPNTEETVPNSLYQEESSENPQSEDAYEYETGEEEIDP